METQCEERERESQQSTDDLHTHRGEVSDAKSIDCAVAVAAALAVARVKGAFFLLLPKFLDS